MRESTEVWRASLGMLASQVHGGGSFLSEEVVSGVRLVFIVGSTWGSAAGAGVVSLTEAMFCLVVVAQTGSMIVHSFSEEPGM
jgi:hypothetical protein